MSTSGSGIDFFVGYAEAEGALAELVPEGALLVLSEEVRSVLDLPEEIGLTEDPETAREDGFVLLATGHPLLMAAARTVLGRGDVGCASLPRPTGLPPTPSALEVKARAQIHADHGRIDVTGTPEATDVMVLRVGALLTYSVSIDERVQELEEVWVFADTGRAVPAELSERLRTTHLEPGGGSRGMAPDEGEEGVAGAHELLCARARKRVDDLARQTATRLGRQLEVVDDYYGRVLSSIDERLGRAAGDRVGMLHEQADATRREWARRRSEVADDLTPSFEVKPFRLHLVAVAAYAVEAAVRRGSRTYPLPLRYVPVLAAYLPPRCPSCGCEAVLVAGKDRLGCRTCMMTATGPPVPGPPAPAPSVPASPAPGPPAPVPPAPAPSIAPTPARARSTAPPAPPARVLPTAPTPARARSAPKRSGGRVTPKGSTSGSSAPKSGVGVAMSFWSSVRSGELRARDAVRHSPMQALLRLYGSLGPALVIGLEDAGRMTAITASPVMVEPDGVCWTDGDLQCSGEEDTPFALYWRSGSRSNLLEVEGLPLVYLGPYLTRRDGYGAIFRERFSHFLTPPPEPLIELDPTAEMLLGQAAQYAGLGYAMRCMAAWWYVTGGDGGDGGGDLPVDPVDSIDHPDPSAAAAIESMVAKGVGMKLTIPALAERYGCSADRVRRHARRLQAAARHATDLRW